MMWVIAGTLFWNSLTEDALLLNVCPPFPLGNWQLSLLLPSHSKRIRTSHFFQSGAKRWHFSSAGFGQYQWAGIYFKLFVFMLVPHPPRAAAFEVFAEFWVWEEAGRWWIHRKHAFHNTLGTSSEPWNINKSSSLEYLNIKRSRATRRWSHSS